MSNPVFQTVLSADWDQLGGTIRKHFFLTPFSEDYICVSGEMSEIYHSPIAKFLIPFGMVFGSIVPFKGTNIPIDVHYNSMPENGNIYWDRVFKFPGKRAFHFKSHMEPVKGNEVIEFVRFGVGMRLVVSAEDGAIVFRSKGYVWRIFGKTIPLPVHLLFGNAYVEERPVDDNSFTMKMVLEHPWFGTLFRYVGRFQLEKEA
jgi:hypothetical protein